MLPPLYEETSLKEPLLTILKRWRNLYKVEYYTDVRTEDILDATSKLQLIRIFQELIDNIHKHALASQISLLLRITATSVVMVVEDDGVGFDGSKRCGCGIGLKNIEMRAKNLNSKYKFKQLKEKGTRFILRMNIETVT